MSEQAAIRIRHASVQASSTHSVNLSVVTTETMISQFAPKGQPFQVSEVKLVWERTPDTPWSLAKVWGRGRIVKHNGHLSGNRGDRTLLMHREGAEPLPAWLQALVEEHQPAY